MAEATHTLKIVIRVIDENIKKIDDAEKGLRRLDESSKKLKPRFDMNNLSWLFGGMALQRMSMSVVRFLLPAMDKLALINDVASKKVMGVAAAFEFLKISLFETLANTPLFQQFVEWIIKGAIWISEFAQKHPQVIEMAMAIGVIGAVLGTLAMATGIFGQLEHLLKLLGWSSAGVGTGGGVVGAIDKINGLLATGFFFYLAWKGFQDFNEGGLSAAIDEILAAVMIPLLGVGWAIAFYLVAQGFKAVTGEDIGTWVVKEVEKIQEKLNEQRLFFPADFGKPTKTVGFLEGTIAGDILDWTYKLGQTLIPGGGRGFLETTNEEMSKLSQLFTPVNEGFAQAALNAEAFDNKLVGESLVPALNSLDLSIQQNTLNIPLMTQALKDAKIAIDDIPNESHKYIYIHTIGVGGGGGNEYSSSITGGSTDWYDKLDKIRD